MDRLLLHVEVIRAHTGFAYCNCTYVHPTQMRTLALGGRYRAPNADTDSESEMDERERLYWEDIEDDFVSRSDQQHPQPGKS